MPHLAVATRPHPFFRPATLALLVANALPLLGSTAVAQENTLETVRVTSTTIDDRFAGKRGEASSTANFSGKQVDERRPQNLIQILQQIPGLTADQSSGDELKIKLRGVENQLYMGEKPGVAIVIDGVPVYERTGKVNIDLDNIESIKVVKGGASYLFGEDALAGAVVITTKRGAKYAGVTVNQDFGSWGYQRTLARAGFAGDWGSGHLQASQRQSDDYYYQSAYNNRYVDGSLRFNLGERSDLTVNFEHADREKDKHGNVTGATQAGMDPRGMLGRDFARQFDVTLDKVNATLAHDLAGGGNLLATVYQYKDHTLYWSSPQNLSAGGQSVSDVNAYTTLNNYHQTQRGAKSEWRDQSGSWAWMGGLDLRRNTYQNLNSAMVDYCTVANRTNTACTGNVVRSGTVMQNDETREATRAAYGELKWSPLSDWVFTANLRGDQIKLDYTGQPDSSRNSVITRSKDFSATSWRLGSNWQAAANTNLFANISTGFRTPTAQQLYGGSISPTGKTLNNDNLKPETSVNYEVGVHLDSAVLGVAYNLQASVFMIERKDYIMATTGDYGTSTTGNPQRYDNIGGVRNKGLEVAFHSDPRREWSLDMAWTLVDSVFTRYDNLSYTLGNPYVGACSASNVGSSTACQLVSVNNTGKRVPRVPRQQLFSTLHWKPMDAVRLDLEMDAKQWAYADEINQERLPGRTLYNLAAYYDVKPQGQLLAGSKWSFFARVDNLFDRNYWTIARGTNDARGYVPGQTTYNGIYNANDLSIIVGKPRFWTLGMSATF